MSTTIKPSRQHRKRRVATDIPQIQGGGADLPGLSGSLKSRHESPALLRWSDGGVRRERSR